MCKPDITWQADVQRENPNDRNELFEIHKDELERLGHKYFIIEGEERLQQAIQKILILKA